jgi:DNA topoisomerase IB
MVQQSSQVDEERAHAREAGRTYVSDTQPGIRRPRLAARRAHGMRFKASGSEIGLPSRPRRCGSAGWRARLDSRRAMIAADLREVRNRNKYERILDFVRALPSMRERIAEDIAPRVSGRCSLNDC